MYIKLNNIHNIELGTYLHRTYSRFSHICISSLYNKHMHQAQDFYLLYIVTSHYIL